MYTSTVTYENKPDTINLGVNTDHLGNVRAVVSDIRQPVDNDGDGKTDEYQADVKFYADYYPFGMLQPGRSFNAGDYRFGFNGMEADDEIAGVKNSYTTHFRQYDPSVGRWWSVDPEIKNYPWQSPYVAFDNNPLNIVDPRGDAASKPEDITKAAKNAVKKVKKEDTEGSTPSKCNIGVNYAFTEITKSKELSKKKANKMIKHMESSDNWEKVEINKVQDFANKGEVVIATYKTSSGSGHVALVVPGKAEKSSGTWNYKSAKKIKGGIPKVMDTGDGMRTTSQSANYSFGKSKQKKVVFYKYKPKIKKTNSNEVAKTQDNKVYGPVKIKPVEVQAKSPSIIKSKTISLPKIEIAP